MPAVEITELAIPASIDEPGGAEFAEAAAIGNAVAEDMFGTPDLFWAPDEALASFRDPHMPQRVWLARVDGEPAARATTEWIVDDTTTAWLRFEVLPAFRGRGLGRALADIVEAQARASGRGKAIVYAGTSPGEGIPSPTGVGSVPHDRTARFMLARGYRLEQVERVSRLPLPAAGLADRLAAARAASGSDYAVHTWSARTPEHWREDIAHLISRMSTDAPSAGLEEPEDVWTTERLVAEEERREREDPRRIIFAAVEHVPSGRLVGFTELSVPPQRQRAVQQWATLVLREHRGHRLGMLLKVANLAHLEEYAPGHPSVITFNAEENRPMLDVNEALGFAPVAVEGAWRKDL